MMTSPKTRPLDVAILLGSPDISGGSNVIFEHAIGLRARGHRVSIVTERPFDQSLLGWHHPAQSLTFVDHAACRGHVYDLAVATWWRTVFDLPVVRARRHAYFVQSIESRFVGADQPDIKALVEFTYRLPLPVVTEASWIARHLRDHYGRRVTVVRNGIRKELFTPDGPVIDATRPAGLRILIEGAIDVPFKRVPLAVRLCRRAGIRDIWLLTISKQGSVPGVTRVFRKLPIAEVGAVYRSCDVLVKLSTVEGMFGPPLEMMHCGGTAITSDVTGHEEYIVDGENALVVPRGEEHAVVDALRRLAGDPMLCARLKAGALRTAEAWPTWEHAVEEMGAFLVDVVNAPADEEAMRYQYLELLRAALNLAGPLWVAQHQAYPGRTLLKIGAKLAGRYAKRFVPDVKPRIPTRKREEVPEAALPVATRPAIAVRRWPPRVCFVGRRAVHLAHTPLQHPGFPATFVDVGTGLDDARLEAIRASDPDWTFVLSPEVLTPASVARLPGIVVGMLTGSPEPALLRRCFPLNSGAAPARSCVVHSDDAALPGLLRDGVNAVAAFLPPVDINTFVGAAEERAWRHRSIPALLVLPEVQTAARLRRVLRRRVDVMEVVAPPCETMLAPLLRETRLSIHLSGTGLAPAKVVRDLVAGCLVVAPCLVPDHGLLPDEHYLSYRNEEDLVRVVQLAASSPERYERVRRVGMERGTVLADPRRYLDLCAALGEPLPGYAASGAQ